MDVMANELAESSIPEPKVIDVYPAPPVRLMAGLDGTTRTPKDLWAKIARMNSILQPILQMIK